MSTTSSIKLSLGPTVVITAIALLAAACGDDPNALTGRRGKGGPGAGEDQSGQDLPEQLQCTAKPEGREYKLFDGSNMAQTRANENVGVNRARIKPYSVMASEYQRVLGVTPEGIKTAGGSFDDPPARWYGEPIYAGVSMNTIFEISFEGCLTYVKAKPALAAAPTADTAKTECTDLMRKAWNRTPSPEEIQGCTDLAVTKLATQTDATRRWAYVCSSVLSSSQFLTF